MSGKFKFEFNELSKLEFVALNLMNNMFILIIKHGNVITSVIYEVKRLTPKGMTLFNGFLRA